MAGIPYNPEEEKRNARRKKVKFASGFIIIFLVIGGLIWLLFVSDKSVPNNPTQDATTAASPKKRENNKLATNIEKLDNQIVLIEKMATLSAVTCKHADKQETISMCQNINLSNMDWLSRKACKENTKETGNLCNEIENSKDVANNLENFKTEISNLVNIDADNIPDNTILVENPIDSYWKKTLVYFLIGILVIIAFGIIRLSFSLPGQMNNLKKTFDVNFVKLPEYSENNTDVGISNKSPDGKFASTEIPTDTNKRIVDDINTTVKIDFSEITDVITSGNNSLNEKIKSLSDDIQKIASLVSLNQSVGEQTQIGDSSQNAFKQNVDKPLPEEPISFDELMNKKDDSWLKVKQGKFPIDPFIETSDNPSMYVIPSGNGALLVPILDKGFISAEHFDQFFQKYYDKQNSPSNERKIIKFARARKVNNGWKFDDNKGIFEFEYE